MCSVDFWRNSLPQFTQSRFESNLFANKNVASHGPDCSCCKPFVPSVDDDTRTIKFKRCQGVRGSDTQLYPGHSLFRCVNTRFTTQQPTSSQHYIDHSLSPTIYHSFLYNNEINKFTTTITVPLVHVDLKSSKCVWSAYIHRVILWYTPVDSMSCNHPEGK